MSSSRNELRPFLIIVNGKLRRDESINPTWSLAYYLREHCNLTGTKVGCSQGGCGACTVFISRYIREEEVFRHYSANACITHIASLHGCHVLTIENLSSRKNNTCHVIQNSIVKGNGSQCGFCTPGMVMSMLAASYEEILHQSSSAITKETVNLDIAKVKRSIQGNLCRCTGYRPILEAFKGVSFSTVPCGRSEGETNDIEDIIGRQHSSASIEPSRTVVANDGRAELDRIETLLKSLFQDKPNSFHSVEFVGPQTHWLRPNSLLQLSAWIKRHPESQLVAACTSPEHHPSTKSISMKKEVVIQIDWLKELHSFEVYENHICVGAGITVAQLKKSLHSIAESLPSWKGRSIKSILCILQRFGSPQIRNCATIGGCLSLVGPASSSSDLQTLANAFEFTALSFNPVGQTHSEMKPPFPSESSNNTNNKASKAVIVNVKIPLSMENEYTWAYKLSRRRFFDTAILNIATKTQVIPPEGVEDAKIFKINLSMGGSAIKRFSLLFTFGSNPQDLTSELFVKLNKDVQKEVFTHLQTHMYTITYISTLAKNLLKKFYEFLHDALHPCSSIAPHSSTSQDPDTLALNSLKAVQSFGPRKGEKGVDDLVWQPIPHSSAFKHATGTATFCDDTPKFKNELVLELVVSKRAHAFIKRVDTTAAMKLEGVVGFISYVDIPGARNKFGVVEKDEDLFAIDKVECVGQIIGGIVATNVFLAKKAVELVQVDYIDCYPRILTISDAISHQAFYEKYSTSLKLGDVEKALEKCDHTLADEVKLGGQMHFYMEPQSAIVIPKGEDGEVEVVITTQNPALVQEAVAEVLGLEANQVVVRVKRVGGAFGGKDTRCLLIALPTAIAAQKFGYPVRCTLDRQMDLQISGKREPFLAKYEVGFNADGRVMAIQMNIYANAGVSLDTSAVPIERAVVNLDNAYNIPNLDIYGVPCKSNKPSNTVFRGPGTVQGSHFIENILDRVAAYLNKDAALIRKMNMYREGDMTPYGQVLENLTLSQCWEECLESANYLERKAEAQLYNSTHLYRKRGVYMTPCHFGIGYIHLPYNQAGALVNIYKDGSVALNYGGVEIGQGLDTKMIQVATRELGINASRIKVLETATDKIPNATPSSASLTSDLNGMAVANACIILKERLAPYTKLVPRLSWDEIVVRAYSDRVNLSAVGYYRIPGLSWNQETMRGSPFSYFVGGAACTEVEVDCLTGEYQILRTDIVMDVGKSLNPAIDLGQIEGAFMQGVGLFTLEEMVYDDFGNLLTTSTSTYKIPTALDIPLEFNVSFLSNASNPRGIYSSKSVGEPPLILANSVFFAIKEAVREFRKQLGFPDTKFKMDSPATVEKVLDACNDVYEPLVV